MSTIPRRASRAYQANATRGKQTPANGTIDAEEEEEEFYLQRPQTSIRRYDQPQVPRVRTRYEMQPEVVVDPRHQYKPASQTPRTTTAAAPAPVNPHRQWHMVWYIGIGMMVMFALFVAGLKVYAWWQDHQNYATYGYPPIFQTDVVVGHNDSPANPSHFIFLNLHGHLEVIEIPGGDESKQKTYLFPQLVTDGFDTLPFTGEFVDVNGDGKPDMIVHIQDQRIVYINTGDGFRPLKPGEHVSLPQQ